MSDTKKQDDLQPEPKFWDVGEEYDDATRKLVDAEVSAALAEYIQNGGFVIDYRLGGSPTISFCVLTDNFDVVPGAEFTRDIGDILLEQWESLDGGSDVMNDLFAALFEVYERWRVERTASDPKCSIPAPELVDGKAPNREPIPDTWPG